ncbi:sigma factor-like helix-turn-helix DNA-binding protein [Paenibacillus mesophilus]|uniref:sigma factor-like helix-turn-helix DNA-binding protein n=1 Tax=Paenibacillus mesophilus TaxID=2582849 RepID=UPI00130538D6|nr:sigma factor-like helix-turn-helix DNA-binding protein [Paenibacillus mesophilus]
MQDLLEGYQQTKKMLRALRTLNTDASDRGLLSSMIGDCDYAIEWLQTGRRPGNRRGIERYAAYQREVLCSFEVLDRQPVPPPPRRLVVNDYNRIIQVLNILSGRERACYEMHYAGLWSEYEIADRLGISRDSVHEYLDRAQKKIKKFISKPVQMELFPLE